MCDKHSFTPLITLICSDARDDVPLHCEKKNEGKRRQITKKLLNLNLEIPQNSKLKYKEKGCLRGSPFSFISESRQIKPYRRKQKQEAKKDQDQYELPYE